MLGNDTDTRHCYSDDKTSESILDDLNCLSKFQMEEVKNSVFIYTFQRFRYK